MKTLRLKALAGFLMIAMIFAACEQEQIIPTVAENLSLNSEITDTPQNHENTINPGCGTKALPEQIEYLSRTREARQNFSHQIQARSSYEIPVAIHIIRQNNGTGGITAQQAEGDLQRLNDFYAQKNISFVQCASIEFIDNTAWYDFDGATEEAPLAAAHDVTNVLNIYYFNTLAYNGNTFSGYSWLPENGPGRDRAMMRNSTVTDPTSTTLVHELGHYLSLYHTHGDQNCAGGLTQELVNGSNCTNTGDDVCDTPADPNLFWGCQFSLVAANCTYFPQQWTGQDGNPFDPKDANGQSYNPDAKNIMSYSLGNCKEDFTEGQWDRVIYSIENDRDYLTCTTSGGGGGECDNDPVLSQYPFANAYVDANNCTSEKITVYNKWSIDWLIIETPNWTRMYRGDTGQLWCTGSNCVSAYGLTNQIATWECCDDGGVEPPQPECDNDPVLTQYPFANTYVDENNCTSEKITVYNKWSIDWLIIETPNWTRMYRGDTGQLWCTGSNCVSAYGLTNQIAEWECCN